MVAGGVGGRGPGMMSGGGGGGPRGGGGRPPPVRLPKNRAKKPRPGRAPET